MNIWSIIYRTACIALALLLVAAVVAAFYPKFRKEREMQRQLERLNEEVLFDKELVQHLRTKQDKLQNDPRFLERVAREELGLSKPGETVFKFVEDSATNHARAKRP